jgi:predicted SnoaL-like aldol condensation-catalyzing enzyme
MRKLFSKLFAVAAVAAVLLSASAQASEPSRVEANKKLVHDFFAAVDEAQASGTMKANGRSIVERFIAPDYIQHRPGEQNGREAMVHRTESAQFLPVGGMPPTKLVALIADGDIVVRVVSFDIPDRATGTTSPALIWNMFRIRDGKLAEHWDAEPATKSEQPPPGGPG